jgi:ABC-2 type transport system permease protein
MSMVRAMIWKEIHSFLHDWKTLATVGLLLLWVLFYLVLSHGLSFVGLNIGLATLSMFLVASVSNTLTWKSFLYERAENALTSVLASPISVAELFLGKTLAVFLFSYLPLLVVAVAACAAGIGTNELPDASSLAMALLAVPVWGLAVSEIMGALCFVLGSFDLVRWLGGGLCLGVSGITYAISGHAQGVWPALAMTAVGLAVAVAVLVLFSKVSKPRLAR